MTQPSSTSAPARSDLPVILLMIVAVLGVIASVILTRHHFGAEVIGCVKNATFDCDKVNRSEWSEFRGIPLSILGLITYVLVFGLALTRKLKGPVRAAGSMAYTLLIGLFSASFSIYLAYVSTFLLQALCPWCVFTYVLNFLVFGLAAWALGGPSQLLPAIRADWDSLGAKKTLAYPLLAVIAIAFGIAAFKPGPWFNAPGETQMIGALGGAGGSSEIRSKTLAAPYRNPGVGGGYAKGADRPALTIIEFADLECGACRRSYWPLHDFVKKHPGEVRLVFRHYPLDQKCNPSIRRPFHEHACDAAMAAEAAGLQGKFWEFIAEVYRLTDDSGVPIRNPELDRASMLERARKLGLDIAQFEDALADELLQDKVLGDVRDGDAFGVQSTPTLYVNGRLVKGLPINDKTLSTWLEMAKKGELDPPEHSSL